MLPFKRVITTDVVLWQKMTDEGHTGIVYLEDSKIGERDWRWAEAFAFTHPHEKAKVEKTVFDNFYQLEFFRGEQREVYIGSTDELFAKLGGTAAAAPKTRKPKT